MKRSWIPLAALALAGTVVGGALAQESACALGEASVRVPLVAHGDPIAKSYHIAISVGGGPTHTVQVDTGSTGIVVPRHVVPAALWETPDAPIHQIAYSSSDNYLVGKRVVAPVRLGEPGVAQTVPIGVLAAACACKLEPGDGGDGPPAALPDRCDRLDGARVGLTNKPGGRLKNCHEVHHGMGMMGVGFARGGGGLGGNPFLRLRRMAEGEMTPGYVITHDAIHLGLTRENTRGFAFVALKPGSTPEPAPLKDWREPEACVGFPDLAHKPLCGALLADTGLATMLLTAPKSHRPAGLVDGEDQVPAGTAMTVTIGEALAYRFVVGERGGPAPTHVLWRGGQSPAIHINTGRHLLAVADYLFDDGCGRVGFRRR